MKRAVLVTAALSLAGAGLQAQTPPARARLANPLPAAARSPLPCPPAAAARLELGDASIDRIEVFASSWSPAESASQVRVETATSERRVRVRGNASIRLSFHPALRGSVIDVSIDPVFSARASACIDRIELWGGSRRLAVVHP